MTEINPFSGYLAQSPQVQARSAAEKEDQLRRAESLQRNATLEGDKLEHEVQSAEAVTPVHEQQPESHQQRPKRSRHKKSDDDETPEEDHLDIKA